MKKLTIFLFIGFLCTAVFSMPANAAFVYDITNYKQVGGTSGTDIFDDAFSDTYEPPVGPYSNYDYYVSSDFGSDRESGGSLELNSDDAMFDEDEIFIGAAVDSTYFYTGVGGEIIASFEINAGYSAGTYFGIEIANDLVMPVAGDEQGPLAFEEAWMGIFIDSSGNKYASFGNQDYNSGIDITSALIGVTAITMKLEIDTSGNVSAFFDFGSDGGPLDGYDLPVNNFTSLSFTEGTYTGGFSAGQQVPIPGAVWLLGSGLVGFVGLRRKFN